MAERIAGIKGYIGELIVREWLKHRYDLPNYSIKTQIRPKNVDPEGGPYLDLCVLKGDEIIEVYEIKTQDYRILQINKSLSYLWKKEKGINGLFFDENMRETACIQGSREEKPFSPYIKAYLITMCPIHDKLAETLKDYQDNIFLLRDILSQLDKDSLTEIIRQQFAEDIKLVYKNICNPKNLYIPIGGAR